MILNKLLLLKKWWILSFNGKDLIRPFNEYSKNSTDYHWYNKNTVSKRKNFLFGNSNKNREENLLRDIQKYSTELIQCTRADGSFIFVSETWKKALLYSDADLQSLVITDILTESSRQKFKNIVTGTSEGFNFEDIELELIAKSGKIVYVIGYATRGNLESASVNTNFFFRNITVKKKLTEELQNQIKFTEDILNHIPADIAIFDDNHNYRYLNPKAISNSETRQWLIGKNDFDYFKFKGLDDSMAVKRREMFRMAIQSTEGCEWIDKHQNKNGEDVYILRKFYPCYDPNSGKLNFVIGYGIDVTNLKSSEIQLRISENQKSELVNELQDKVNQLMQFNYIISHNLRSPLANILGLCNILETDADKDEMGVVVDGLKKSAENIDNLIKNLSEILSLSMPLNKKKTWVDMSDLLNHTISIFENQLTESGIEVDISIGENATKVFSICSYIESILYNLLSNAIKYKSPVRKPIISISLFKKEEQFHVIFTDNGIGIDMHRYGKDIFGLYKRFNFETEGKGLGLHMVKVQVQALGGKIDVSSTPGNGSCFSILLPAPEDELMD